MITTKRLAALVLLAASTQTLADTPRHVVQQHGGMFLHPWSMGTTEFGIPAAMSRRRKPIDSPEDMPHTDYLASIEYNNSGIKKLYFSFYGQEESNCTDEDASDNGIARVNGQGVRVIVRCGNYADSDQQYYLISPSTPEGQNFIVEALSSAKDHIELRFNGFVFPISALGFRDLWDGIDDAL